MATGGPVPASIRVDGVGVRFAFDAHSRVVTPVREVLARRSATHTWGLRDVSCSIGPGEGVAVVGATGSGKTSLLRVIAGVLPSDEGRTEVTGTIGSLLSIDAGLLPTLTGRESAMLLAVLAGLSRRDARAALGEIHLSSRLGEAFDRPASSYSQGMRARLGFAAAQAATPRILLLDEVHEAFDHEFRETLQLQARELLDSGGIVVAAGHDHDVLETFCSRALLLSGGRVVNDASFGEVRAQYRPAALPRSG